MSNNFDVHYESVERFNVMAGNLKSVTTQSIKAQLDFIAEELLETFEAYDENNNVELLDGACDLFVTVAGLLQKLDVAGYNVDEAVKRVCDNNISKFPHMQGAGAICPDGANVEPTEFDRVVFKRASDGKVMKPTNFKAVDITDCVPLNGF